MGQLHLDQARIDRARGSARRIARQVFDEMGQYTTTTVERATLRLLGIDHTRLTYKFQGRHHRLTDVHGQVVEQILA